MTIYAGDEYAETNPELEDHNPYALAIDVPCEECGTAAGTPCRPSCPGSEV